MGVNILYVSVFCATTKLQITETVANSYLISLYNKSHPRKQKYIHVRYLKRQCFIGDIYMNKISKSLPNLYKHSCVCLFIETLKKGKKKKKTFAHKISTGEVLYSTIYNFMILSLNIK